MENRSSSGPSLHQFGDEIRSGLIGIESRSNFTFPTAFKQPPAATTFFSIKPGPPWPFQDGGNPGYIKTELIKNPVALKESPPCRVFGIVKPIEIGGQARICFENIAYDFL